MQAAWCVDSSSHHIQPNQPTTIRQAAFIQRSRSTGSRVDARRHGATLRGLARRRSLAQVRLRLRRERALVCSLARLSRQCKSLFDARNRRASSHASPQVMQNYRGESFLQPEQWVVQVCMRLGVSRDFDYSLTSVLETNAKRIHWPRSAFGAIRHGAACWLRLQLEPRLATRPGHASLNVLLWLSSPTRCATVK